MSINSYVVGVDLGGTRIRGAIADNKGNILSKYKMDTNSQKGSDEVFKNIKLVIDNVIQNSNSKIIDIESISIAAPGPIDINKGVILNTPNLPFENFNIVKKIQDAYGIRTYLENDANAAAIGEFMFGSGKGSKNMIYITISTGVGGGAVLDGKLYHGSSYNALEIGHMTIIPDGPKCNCGNYGCLESLSSGTAIRDQALKFIRDGKDTSLLKYDIITSAEVFKEAENGDKISKDILDRSLNFLGIGVANLVTMFNPDVVVIGGGVSRGGKIVFDKIRNVVNKRCFLPMSKTCKIVKAGLGDDSGLIGTVAIAMMQI
ncbi:ROK family protein [Clostridium fermenticellae]|uniref:ROK family protein n=1 Tax=Clostridium fermenticellae TaxID=2068654 RepID=A0A386H0M0_9CLOT|nr:ROK family protein [Clostridium fermenticellae]